MPSRAVERYQPQVYDALRTVTVVAEESMHADLDLLGQVIRDFGLQDTVGVALAHRHFDLAPDEALLQVNERCGSVTAPMKLDDLAQLDCVVPCAWKYITTDGNWCPVQFCVTDDTNLAVPWWENEPFMCAIGQLMMRHGWAEVYTLNTLSEDDLHIPDGMMYVETNELIGRRSVVDLRVCSNLSEPGAIATLHAAKSQGMVCCLLCFEYGGRHV